MGDVIFTRRFNVQELINDGSEPALAGINALDIKNKTGTNDDGYYWINLGNGQGPQQVYCIMNSAVSGGGWMMLWSAPAGSITTSTRFSANTQNLPTTSMPFNYYSLNYSRRSGVNAVTTQNQSLVYAGVNNWLTFSGKVWDSSTHNSGNFRFEFNTGVTTSNGTQDTTVEVGFTNFGISTGGEFGIATSTNGLDHHNTNEYYNLNTGCTNMYLYTHGFGYKVNTGLSGWWTSPLSSCTSSGTSTLPLAVLMR